MKKQREFTIANAAVPMFLIFLIVCGILSALGY